jgi:hypothetical protein
MRKLVFVSSIAALLATTGLAAAQQVETYRQGWKFQDQAINDWNGSWGWPQNSRAPVAVPDRAYLLSRATASSRRTPTARARAKP